MSAQPRPPPALGAMQTPSSHSSSGFAGFGPLGIISAEDHGVALLLASSGKGFMLLRKRQQIGGIGVVPAG